MGHIPIPLITLHNRDALYSGKENGTITDSGYSSGIAGLGSGLCIAFVIIISLGLYLSRRRLFSSCTNSRAGSTERQRQETLTEVQLRSLDRKSAPFGISHSKSLPKGGKEAHECRGLSSESKECSICAESYVDGATLRRLPCGHEFHRACVDPWLLKRSGTCPLW